MINHPRLLSFVCLLGMWCCALLGAWLRERYHGDDTHKASLTTVVSATLTLLGLVISFTFSMATNRYDQRKLYEESEANAIGTEYLRADLLPAQTAQIKAALLDYLHRRIDFYQVDYGSRLVGVDAQTVVLQARLWSTVKPAVAEQPSSITALVVSGMNEVINSQGYTQYEWWNRIPTVAWVFLIVIAMFANLLVGYSTKRSRSGTLLLLVLPVVVATSFFLVADIDSPRGGIIRIQPRNLMSLQETLQSSRCVPTSAWSQYRGASHRKVLGDAIRSGYAELFAVYPDADKRSQADLEHVFSTSSSGGRQVIGKLVSTFKALADEAEFPASDDTTELHSAAGPLHIPAVQAPGSEQNSRQGALPSLHIDVQIHISPEAATEQIDQIFASMAKHLYGAKTAGA